MRFKMLLSSLLLLVSLQINAQPDIVADAIHKDDVDLFKKYCARDRYQASFYGSVQQGSLRISEYLIEQDVDLNKKDSTGSTALIAAVNNGHNDIVNMLLAKGADPNVHDEGMEATALMYAAASTDRLITSTLLSHHADINAIDVNGDPAINWATFYGHVDVMKLLIQKGADLNIMSKHGNAVDVAFRLWHADSVAEVFRAAGNGKVLTKREKGLSEAVKKGDLSSLEKWLVDKTSPNMVDELGTPLIHLASEPGHQKFAEGLLAKGADLNKLNSVGQSALSIAARFGHLSLVDYYLKQGADPNLAGQEYQLTPLIAAAVNGDVNIGRKLIAGGAKLDHADIVNKASALYWAMFYDHEDFALMLIENGANYHLKVLDEQYDAMEIARLYGYDRISNTIARAENFMIGSWLIREIDYIYKDTTYVVKMTYPGRLIVTSNSYAIMYNPYGSKRNSPEALSKMSDEEKIYSFNTIVFNSGEYEISDSTFVTKADLAKVAGFEGGLQYYRINIEPGNTSLVMYDELYPGGGKPDWLGKLQVKFVLDKEE